MSAANGSSGSWQNKLIKPTNASTAITSPALMVPGQVPVQNLTATPREHRYFLTYLPLSQNFKTNCQNYCKRCSGFEISLSIHYLILPLYFFFSRCLSTVFRDLPPCMISAVTFLFTFISLPLVISPWFCIFPHKLISSCKEERQFVLPFRFLSYICWSMK